ncbi:MAG: transposase [Nitrosopumilus sp.]|nr:transposase [Nitrosopumilus sp.]
MENLSDQQALDELSFDFRWQHALGVEGHEAYLSRRSLVEFRRRLVQQDPEGVLIREVFDRVCAAGLTSLKISTAEQRLDSTLVCSDIRRRGRLRLAQQTLRVFVRSLEEATRLRLPEAVLAWYANADEGWSDEPDGSKATGRLLQAGQWIAAVVEEFEQDPQVSVSEPYQLLVRMLQEHAEALGQEPVQKEPEQDDDDDRDGDHDCDHDDDSADSGDRDHDDVDPQQEAKGRRPRSAARHTKAVRASKNRRRNARRRKGKKNAPETKARYWSAHDPDASFGHKGLGYHVHVTETCRNEGVELITDYDVLTAAQSDVGQARLAVQRLRERDIAPKDLYADGGYPTPSDLVWCAETGTELVAPVNRGRIAPESLSRMDFERNAQGEVIGCPEGYRPTRVAARASSDSESPRRSLHVFFDAAHCDPCPRKARCPVRTPNNARSKSYRLDVGKELMARDERWVQQQTQAWKRRYRIRAGIEATVSELKRAHGLGQLRVRTIARVRLQTAFKVTACNIKRWARAVAADLTSPERRSERLYALLALLTALCFVQRPRRRSADPLPQAAAA